MSRSTSTAEWLACSASNERSGAIEEKVRCGGSQMPESPGGRNSSAPGARARRDSVSVSRLKVGGALYRSLRSTNLIENLNGSVAHFARNVRRWRGGTMIVRWVATAVREAEKKFRRLRGYKEMPQLLAALGIIKSQSRPHVSNDNPFSESHFKTLKYQPRFPKRFGCIEDAQSFCRQFFDWYNQDHHHAGIGLMTPDQVHYGQIDLVHAARQLTLDEAFHDNPERFVNKAPTPPDKPTAAWINPPTPKATA